METQVRIFTLVDGEGVQINSGFENEVNKFMKTVMVEDVKVVSGNVGEGCMVTRIIVVYKEPMV